MRFLIDGTATLQADLVAGDADAYVLQVLETQQIGVFTNSAMDTIGWLEDEAGERVTEDDDSGDSLNSHLSATVEPGFYRLTVQGYSVDEEGNYQLVIVGGEQEGQDDHGDILEDATWFDPYVSSSIRAYLDAGDVDTFAIPFPVGTFQVTTLGHVDTYGTLYDDEDVFVDEDDDSGEDTNFSFTFTTFQDLMFLEVRGYSEFSEGSYELVVQELD